MSNGYVTDSNSASCLGKPVHQRPEVFGLELRGTAEEAHEEPELQVLLVDEDVCRRVEASCVTWADERDRLEADWRVLEE